SKESDRLALLITADNLMTDICFAEGIPYFRFQLPHNLDDNPYMSKPKQLRRLLYNLASLMGFIKVNNTILFGEYRGKIRSDQLKARFLNHHTFEEFKTELKICRKLTQLNITK
ncbi:MAG: hypothetical protein ACOC6G_04090, partial [Thermoproteota archaeon]